MDITSLFLLVLLAIALAWEAYSLRRDDDNVVTISHAVVAASKKHLWIPVGIGLLMGHWFWPFCPPCG